MLERIVKDIRLYESETENVSGQSLPSELGNILKPTENTNVIAQRIARKLNELHYTFGEQDHIYINLSTLLDEDDIRISNRAIDKRIKYIDAGISQEKFNALSDQNKDTFVEHKILEIFKVISSETHQELIEQTAFELSKYGREIKIHFKTKETKSYRITIYYQIAPFDKRSVMIIDYLDKKNEVSYLKNFDLHHHEDIYALIGNITVKDNKVMLQPKKSSSAEFVTKKYKTPIELELK
ncbi:hypothetical protein MHTCC0001_31830 [Flavobacteriaceae bacterium MHTCC 0001]